MQTLSREYKHGSHQGGGGRADSMVFGLYKGGGSGMEGGGRQGVWRALRLSPWSIRPASVQGSRHAIIRAMDEPDGAGN